MNRRGHVNNAVIKISIIYLIVNVLYIVIHSVPGSSQTDITFLIEFTVFWSAAFMLWKLYKRWFLITWTTLVVLLFHVNDYIFLRNFSITLPKHNYYLEGKAVSLGIFIIVFIVGVIFCGFLEIWSRLKHEKKGAP